MINITSSTEPKSGYGMEHARPIYGVRFEWVIAVLSSWLIGGIYLDAWAHHQFVV